MPRVLLVDDEETFRTSLARRMRMHGYETCESASGEEAIRAIRADQEIDVVVLDRMMPEMSGEQVLREIKRFRPELLVIILTGHGDMMSAVETGRLDAYAYLQKPCDFEGLVGIVEAARRDKFHVLARHEVPHVQRGSWARWLLGSHNSRPGIIALGLLVFAAIAFAPAPHRLHELLSTPKTDQPSDLNRGYAAYGKMKPQETIAEYYSRYAGLRVSYTDSDGRPQTRPLNPAEAASRAQVMLGILVMAALFWASGAMPVGVTALLVGATMYLLGVLRPDDVAKAYAKDAVIFIFGVVALAGAIAKTGLDRRIGLLLLGPCKSLERVLFLFLPLVAIACSFLSEHALVAFMMPMLMMVYALSVRAAGLKEDRRLAVMFVLALCFAANCGGPGSPAAGGRKCSASCRTTAARLPSGNGCSTACRLCR